ncbi:MAG: zinc ribbon domain-containing protein, partial [Planctomycetes bacterium]|nr:zinc ribbon domain-containing protein [Planctomycetota bacterium]
MPRKKFKCSRCSRMFSMPAHLARHMNTTHASP